MLVKRLKIIVWGVALAMLLVGCNKSDDTNSDGVKDISGEWSGYLIMDDSGNEMSADTLYSANIEQNGDALTVSLILPPEFEANGPIELFGLRDGEKMTLSGLLGSSEVVVNGIIEDENSLQFSISGVVNETQIISLTKKGSTLVTASFSNEYKLELKLGTAGKGRSIILVHGMDDDADTWDDMIDYFKDHDIAKNYNVWVFEYKWWLHIDENGLKMYRMIGDKMWGDIHEYPIIVAHSMGGLVSRSYISMDSDPRFHYRLITLGTPHLGSGLASLINIFAWADVTGVQDLAPGSSFLKDLNSNDSEKKNHPTYWLLNGKVGTYFYCYAHIGDVCVTPGYKWHSPKPPANIKAGHAALSKPNDGMVPRSSARFEGDDDVHRVDDFEWVDHISLNKNKDVCEWVTNFIKEHPLE
ncbi:MAG: hypothetical protein AB7S54_02300 [Bacteroidales bacterium]